jgi:hypothetical protein
LVSKFWFLVMGDGDGDGDGEVVELGEVEVFV